MHILTLQTLVSFSKSKSPWFFLVAIGFSVFTAEVLVMFFFMAIPKLPELMEAVLDGTLLSILVAPALYYFLYKPLSIEIRERERIEEELRRSANQLQLQTETLQEYSESLELKIAERTQELTAKNLQLQKLLEKLHTTQVQMVQKEKMSSLGQLVAGVAHEINNPVNFIHGNLSHIREYTYNLLSFLELYQKYYPDPIAAITRKAREIDLEFLESDIPKLLNSMQMGADRIREIVVSLRNFSRLDEAELKTVNIHEGINSTLLILQHRLKARPKRPEILIIKDYGNLPLIECYPGQLNQVIMSILTNAIDSLELRYPKDSLGEFNSKQRDQEINDRLDQIKICTSKINEQWVEIKISDNGLGIPAKMQQQIFNPFFTTKHVGQGTGMGLAISYQIITEKHSGKLECYSTVGVGTDFIIQIPVKQLIY